MPSKSFQKPASPERGLIPPLEFISYAEESELIVPLGRWVILDVVRQIAKWRNKGINLRVAVNFSARQLADQTLFTALKQVLHEPNFDYCPIDVELTESCLIKNGINERQGFLFAKPMPAVSFERWYKRYQAKKCVNDGDKRKRTTYTDWRRKERPFLFTPELACPIFLFSFQINFCIMNLNLF